MSAIWCCQDIQSLIKAKRSMPMFLQQINPASPFVQRLLTQTAKPLATWLLPFFPALSILRVHHASSLPSPPQKENCFFTFCFLCPEMSPTPFLHFLHSWAPECPLRLQRPAPESPPLWCPSRPSLVRARSSRTHPCTTLLHLSRGIFSLRCNGHILP